MKNILSYQPGSIFTGKELNEFFSYAIEHKTSKAKIAMKYLDHFKFKDNRLYRMYRGKMRDGGPMCSMFLMFDRVQ